MPSRMIDQELLNAAQAGDAAKVSELLACGADPRSENYWALRVAADLGYSECVRLLLPASDPKAGESNALRVAAWNGHAECVRMLLPGSDAKAAGSAALRWAAKNGHAECVRLLMTASGPLREIDGLLEQAIEGGSAKVAALLIAEEPRLLDGVNLSQCLVAAQEGGHVNIASYLSSIIEQKELVGVASDGAACGGRRHARL